MTNDFNLMSQKWLDLVFKDRNKAFGAYEMRESSSDRHLRALVIVTIVGLALIYLPGLIKNVIPEGKDITQVSEVEMTDLDLEREIPEENTIKEIEVPPPPPLKATQQFVPPTVVKDEEVNEDQQLLTQDELTDSEADISVATYEGDEGGYMDIAELQDNKIVVQEEEGPPVIYDIVEEDASFPGGTSEMYKWIRNNLVYPPVAEERGIEGTVQLVFVVTPEGAIEQVEVLKTFDVSCDNEAVRIVKKMPTWSPAKINGKPVHMRFRLPVTFKMGSR